MCIDKYTHKNNKEYHIKPGNYLTEIASHYSIVHDSCWCQLQFLQITKHAICTSKLQERVEYNIIWGHGSTTKTKLLVTIYIQQKATAKKK